MLDGPVGVEEGRRGGGESMQSSVAQKEMKVMTLRAEAGREPARGVTGAKAQPELTRGPPPGRRDAVTLWPTRRVKAAPGTLVG